MKRYSESLTEGQRSRREKVENATYNFISVLAEIPADDWKMADGQEVNLDEEELETICSEFGEVLRKHGVKMWYPFAFEDVHGKRCTFDYIGEECMSTNPI